jgi:two-component system, NarL family, sensor kinase
MSNTTITLIIATTALVILLSTFIIFLLFLYQKNQFAVQQNIKTLKAMQEKDMLRAQVEVQEHTFQRISAEIHDHIVPDLILSKLNLYTLNHRGPVSNQEKVTSSESLIIRVIEKLSDISKSLNSEFIRENGLFHALESEISMLRNTGMYNISFTVSGVRVPINPEKAVIIFRIIQEGLTNIVKHSNASAINIEIKFEQNLLRINVEDNGTGFNIDMYEQTKLMRGSGLKNIRQRTTILEGHCELESSIGTGTKLNINIPFPN